MVATFLTGGNLKAFAKLLLVFGVMVMVEESRGVL
jgi:hypothetical protein